MGAQPSIEGPPLSDQSHPVFALSSEFVDEVAALAPTWATYAGVAGNDHRWPDLSPAGHAATLAHYRGMVERLEALPEPETKWDRLAFQAVGSFLSDAVAVYESNDHLRELDSIASEAQTIVDIFEHMDKSTPEGWTNICTRLSSMDAALDGYKATLAQGIDQGLAVAQRQVTAVAEQSRVAASDDSPFEALLTELAESDVDRADLPPRLAAAVAHARAAQAEFGEWLVESYLPHAVAEDAVGRERYVRAARRFLGMDIDPEATYAWGWDEVARLRARMEEVADEISPGATILEALQILKTDPARAAATRGDFISFMKARNAVALAKLEGSHFDVPDAIREVDVRLAKPGGPLGAYYVGPSEDYTRPGAVWWSHGDNPGPFPLYDEVSTLYHEGFPGHHLQVGTQLTSAENLSRFHRLFIWYPGLGEGWALYAELLMEQMGFLDKPDYVFGFLSAQMLRACRVVIDIGSHLELPIPDDQPFHPGEDWSFELAVEMLQAYATLEKEYAESEATRYLGWPGQAIAYKVGEREILDIRATLEARGDFNAKAFHANLLEIGPVGLSVVRELLLG
jgi:uncharacterized protein (DUF885 family)